MEFAKTKEAIKAYLPDEKDWVHLDRQWLGDVMYTVDTKSMDELIAKAREKRKEKIEKSHNELVDMKPEFVKALEKCVEFSGKDIYC